MATKPMKKGASALRAAMPAGADSLIDLVERLGLVDLIMGNVKSRIAETDVDEVMDDTIDYLRRNPEVLVVTLGAVTVATGLLVWLNKRREWDGSERRNGEPARSVSQRKPAAPRRPSGARTQASGQRSQA